MTFPVVASRTETVFTTNATAHLVAMPATVNVGDVLVCLFGNDGSATTVTTPTGWTQESSEGNGARLGVYSRTADGTEGGTTVDFVTSIGEKAAAQVFRLTGAQGDVEVGTSVATNDATAEHPSLTPSWGAADTLWIAVSARAFTRTVSSFPTNYTDGLDSASGYVDNTDCQLAAARRELNAATESGAVTTFSGTDSARSQTVAIRPSASDIDITPTPVAIPIVIPAPVVTVHRIITPTALTIPVVIPAPVVTLSLQVISPTPVTIPIIIAAPSIGLFKAYQSLARLLNPTDWGGTPTLILEIHALTSSAGSPIKAYLWNVTDSAKIAGSDISSTNTVLDRLRSGAFSLAVGSKEYEVRYGGVSLATYTMEDAVLIVTP